MPDNTDTITDETTQETAEAPQDGQETTEDTEQPDTFPRAYVEQLRQENARYRTRAGEADVLAERLHRSIVAATGRLADPTDLPFDAGHLDDEDALTAAVDDLLARKPHLASRRPAGDVGQGATETGHTVDLAGLLRGFAG